MDIKNIKKYFKYISIIFIIIGIIFVVIYYLYYDKIKESFKTNNEINYTSSSSDDDNKIAKIYFFHVDWCPHCKTASPEWKKFNEEMNNKKVKDYTIQCIEYNCTTETAEITKLVEKYNIEGYPTIKMIKDNEVYDFDAKVTQDNLNKFCYTMI